jgi:hypothetical protein
VNPAHNDFRYSTTDQSKNGNFAFIDSLEKEVSQRKLGNQNNVNSMRREAGLNDLKNSQDYYNQMRAK